MNRYIIIFIVYTACIATCSYIAGKHSRPDSVKVVTNTATVKNNNKDTTDHKIVTITKTMDDKGRLTEVTTIKDDKETKDNSVTTTKTSVVSTTQNNTSNKTNIAVMAELNNLANITYGAHVQRQLIGPINVGVFGYTDKKFGVSIGLSF